MLKLHKNDICWVCAGVWLLMGILLSNYLFLSIFSYLFCAVPLLYLLSCKLAPKAGKVLRRVTAAVLAALFLLCAIVGGLVISAAGGREGEADYLIVLGTKVVYLEPSPQLQERIDAAADYLTAHPKVTAILTGGKGSYDTLAEAVCMYNSLVDAGISPDRLIKEPWATSTEENLEKSLPIIDAHAGSRPETVAILSSEYHLYRADLFAREMGLNTVLIPAKTGDILFLADSFLWEIFLILYYSTIG